jgi:hypothetical protein
MRAFQQWGLKGLEGSFPTSSYSLIGIGISMFTGLNFASVFDCPQQAHTRLQACAKSHFSSFRPMHNCRLRFVAEMPCFYAIAAPLERP